MSDLLPPNSTEQEESLSKTVERIGSLPVDIKKLWNPQTCPVALLPWLAWALSVDTWKDGWTEQQKRAVIATAFGVHNRKGTVGAVKTAIGALGLDAKLTEWFEEVPQAAPYTFYVTVTVDQIGLPTLSLYRSIIDTANSTKNVRSHMTGIEIEALTSGTEYLGAVACSGDTVTIMAEPI